MYMVSCELLEARCGLESKGLKVEEEEERDELRDRSSGRKAKGLDRLRPPARLKRLLRTANEQAETGALLLALAQQSMFLPDALVVFEQRLFVAS